MIPVQILVWCVTHKESKGRRFVVARWNPRSQMYERPRHPDEMNGSDVWIAGSLSDIGRGGHRSRVVAVRQAARMFNVPPVAVSVQRGRGYLGDEYAEHRGRY